MKESVKLLISLLDISVGVIALITSNRTAGLSGVPQHYIISVSLMILATGIYIIIPNKEDDKIRYGFGVIIIVLILHAIELL